MVNKFGEKYRKKKQAGKSKRRKKGSGIRGAKKPPLAESGGFCTTGKKTVNIKMNNKFQIIEEEVIDEETNEKAYLR